MSTVPTLAMYTHSHVSGKNGPDLLPLLEEKCQRSCLSSLLGTMPPCHHRNACLGLTCLTTVFWSHRTPLLFHMLYPFSPAFMYIAAVACSALHVQFLSFYFAPKVRLPTFVCSTSEVKRGADSTTTKPCARTGFGGCDPVRRLLASMRARQLVQEQLFHPAGLDYHLH